MEKLRIDSPCQENWNEFTPKPEGGFCGSCAKIVIDFTNKTNQQIKAILETKQNESVCGRIGVSQLANYNMTLAEWQSNQKPEVVQSRFIWAVVLAFGVSLFTSFPIHSQNTMGKMIVQTDRFEDSTKVKQKENLTLIKTDTLQHQDMIMGEMAAYEEPIDTVNATITDTTKKVECKKPIPPKYKIRQPVVMGMMILPVPKNKTIEDDPKSKDSIKQLSVETETLKPKNSEEIDATLASSFHLRQNNKKDTIFSLAVKDENAQNQTVLASIFPNPTINQSILSLHIKKTAIYDAKLFDSDGKICQHLFSKTLEVGSYKHPINFTALKPGQYYVTITSLNQQTTVKLIKN